MDSQQVRNLQEAYIGVYDGDIREKLEFESWVNNLLEEGYDLSDYTWEEMYENYTQLDEAFKPLPTEKLDNKIKKLAVSSDSDSGRRQGNIGRVRSNIGKSQKTQSFGSTESQKRKSAKHHAKSYLRQNRHSTQDTKDKPDLYTRAVGYYIDRGEDAKKKHLQRMNKESYDLYDIILSHLITEGYADTNENALVIMANMSEDWRESIVNEGKSSRPRYPAGRGVLDQETRDEKREASAENMRGHTEGPGTVTKNPKKLRKQKSMG